MVDWKSKEHFEYIDCLENIIPLLEGSLYHQQAVAYLFNYYSTMKNHLTSLEWAWVLKKHHKTAYEKIKTSVQGIIYEFMRNKWFEKQGLIYTLRIFERFVEELPSSPYIADFILDLTDKLHRIGLLQESIHLIENYIRREDVRLTLKKQQEVFFQLLDYYIKNEDEVKAKDLLSMISDRGEISKGDVEKKEVFKARIALLKDKTEEALAALQANHSLEGMKIKSSILWEKKNWSGVAAALEELVDKYGGQLNPEIRERYIVHLAAALVLNEEKYPAKNMGRQKTRLSIQNISQKYESVLSKYKALLHELTTEPHNSFQETLTRDVIKKEIDETNRLEKLFDELKAVPTN